MNSQFIFIYCSENQALANKFSGDLSTSGATFIHIQADKETDISTVLNSTTPAILLVTDNFLKNQNCLHKAYSNYGQLIKSGRLLIVVAEGHIQNSDGTVTNVPTQFERVSNIIQYMNYWQDQYLAERKKLNLNQSTEENVQVIKAISAEVGDFIRNMKESNFQYYENLTARNYQQFCQLAGLPMPNIDLPRVEPIIIPSAQITDNETVIEEKTEPTNIETPILDVVENVNTDEIKVEVPIKNQTEEETIDSIISSIPDINTKQPDFIKSDNNFSAKEIDEDDFFDEKEEATSDSNISEIMNEVVAEEERDTKEILQSENTDIEDIFEDEENEDIDDLFQNITNGKSDDILENMPSEVNEEIPIASKDSENVEIEEEPQSNEILDPEELIMMGLDSTEEDKIDDRIEISAAEISKDNIPESSVNEIETTNIIEEKDSILPISIKDRLILAKNYAKQQNFKKATAELEEILAESPNNPDAYFLMAEVSEFNQDYISAKSFYEKVVELSPYYPTIYNRLSHLCATQFPDERKKAKKFFKKAIDLDEDNVNLMYSYAEFLNEDEDSQDKAIKYFKRVIKLNPEHPFANYDLAMIYHNAGEHSLANEFYLEACTNNPELATPENDRAFADYHILDVQRAGEAINLHNFEEEDQLQPLENEEIKEAINEEEIIELPDEKPQVLDENVETEQFANVVKEQEIAAEYVTKTNKYKPKADAKIVLITGATAGIGRATAEIFASHGYNLILTGRREERLVEMQNEFHAKYKGGCIILNFDIRNLSEIQVTLNNLDKDWKNVDILINNAGLAIGMNPIHEGNFEHWDTMIDTNIKGLLYMTRMIAPQMVSRKTGHIINLCSTAGKEAYPNGNIYCATKFAVEALTKCMRIDLHKFGIRVGQVSPGAVEETEFSEVRFEGDKERAAKIYEGFLPLRASDVADIIFYVASAPSHVNIQDVLVMGTQQASATIIDRSGR